MKHTIEIELPDGWEPDTTGVKFQSDINTGSKAIGLCVPVREVWKWPEWLTAEWIVRMPDGRWIGVNSDPIMIDAVGCGYSGWFIQGPMADLDLTTFVPPPCDGWRKSKRRNPRSKSV